MGVFLEDLKPQVGNFWRSRPINLQLWFGVKFVTGLIVLAAAFGSLLLLAYWLQADHYFRPQNFVREVTVGAMVFVLIYTLAMAVSCLVRQLVFAAVATLGLFAIGVNSAGWVINRLSDEPHWSVGLAVVVVSQIVCTLLAWLAVRNNWGWQK